MKGVWVCGRADNALHQDKVLTCCGGLRASVQSIPRVRCQFTLEMHSSMSHLVLQQKWLSFSVHAQGPEKRAEYGIKDNLVRLACGIENVEDIWADLEQALAQV